MKKGWQWPVAICAFLGLTVVVDLTTLYVASTHPTLAAEPDYYEKALRWDEEQAQLAASDKLGWRVEVVEFVKRPGGFTEVSVQWLDRDGQPLTDAAPALETFHVTRPKNIVTADLEEKAPGLYIGQLTQATRPGLWQLNFRCQRGNDEAFNSMTQFLGKD